MNTNSDSQQFLHSLSNLEFCRLFFHELWQAWIITHAKRSYPVSDLIKNYLSLTETSVVIGREAPPRFSFSCRELDKELRRRAEQLPSKKRKGSWGLFNIDIMLKGFSPMQAAMFTIAVLQQYYRESNSGGEFCFALTDIYPACQLLPLPTIPPHLPLTDLVRLSEECVRQYCRDERKRMGSL